MKKKNRQKWNTIWKMNGWCIEWYDNEKCEVRHESGLTQVIKYPPLVKELMRSIYNQGQRDVQKRMKDAIEHIERFKS